MIKKVIENRRIMLFFVMIIAIAGIYSYRNLPRQESPDLQAPIALITAVYPGASPVDVEQLVTRKIEETISVLDGYEESNSYSNNSYSTVVVKFKYGTDTKEAFSELRRAIDDLQEDVPDEVQKIDVNTDITQTSGMLISLSSDTYSYEALGKYGDEIIERLGEIDGISKFEVVGEVNKEVLVEIDYQKLNQLGISLEEITQLLKSQNLEIPSGRIDDGSSKINITMDGTFQSLQEIENTIINVSSDNGSVLRLKDIGRVYFQDEESSTKYLDEGRKSILISGYFEENENILVIGEAVRNEINQIKLELPKDLIFREVVFQPEEVDNSINSFIYSLLIGILLVILVVLIGMGARNAVIVSMAIPLSIMSTFLIMPQVGIQIHQISITALIVALGMLVDNAIVVSDSIQYKLDAGVPKIQACDEGTKEVSIPILSSTLTTVAAFSPLLFLNSLAGDFVKSLPVIVIIALTASYLIAQFVTPSMAYIFFKPKTKESKFNMQNTIFYRLLEHALDHKRSSLLIGLAIIALLGSSFLALDLAFFPKADKDIMYIDIIADKNIDIEYTQSVTDQIETILKEEPGVISYTTALGGGLPKFYNTMPVTTAVPSNAQMIVKVDLSKTDYKKNTSYSDVLQNKIDENLVGGQATIKELEYAEPIGSPINIRFYGDDMEAIELAVNQAEIVLKNIDGTKNIHSNLIKKAYEFNINIDESKASYLGITKYDALNEISIALRGRNASTYRIDGDEYNIVVKSDIDDIEALENLAIKSSITGNKILVKDIGTVTLKTVTPTIIRFNEKYSIKLSSDVTYGYNRDTIQKELKTQLNKIEFENVNYEFDGENEMIAEYFGNLGVAGITAIVIIYIILLIQFKSFKQPLVILLTVPLASVGSLFGLFLTGQPLSFTALVGIISLIGIVVNNAIVLLDYINTKMKEGMGVDEACKTASMIRFRPIILSTVTTVIGLIPLVVSNSELFKPMAVALMFGLLVSTFLTLIFVPLVFSMVFKEKNIE